MSALAKARWLALLVPAALLAGAYASQYWGGLYPCEMCWWQRYAHFVGLAFAALAFVRFPDRGRSLVWLTALAILTSGLIGAYHAGVELDIFEGFTQCTAAAPAASSEQMLADLFARPMVRCDEVQWSFLGISMAGWNALVSIGSGLLILWLSLKRPRPA